MTLRSASSYALVTAHLLRAMGLASPIALAVAASACGGNVVVDPAGEGGRGAGSSSGTDSEPCAGVPLTEGRVDVCYVESNQGCEEPTAEAVFPHLDPEQISSTFCDNFCCTTITITDILCVPVQSVPDACCYRASVSVSEVCEGRPFLVGGEARTAPAAARADWRADTAPDAASLPDPARRALAAAWARDGRFEHASIASFARFILELLSVGAPPDLVADAQAALQDEIRHAALCFGLASAYAGAPIGPGPLPMDDALRDRRDLPSIAAAVIREGCVGETVAALAAMAARDGAEDPAVRAALEEIAGDELRHATLSWRFAAWAVRAGGEPVRAAIAAAFDEDGTGSEGAPQEPDEHAALLSAHGRLSPDAERRVAARALAEVVRPSAAALLAGAVVSRLDSAAAG